MKKKVGIAVLIFVIVSLAVTCGWQFQKQRSVTSELAEARANLSTEQQKSADLAGQLDDLKGQLADLQAQFEAAQSELETARSDLQAAQQEAEAARQQAETDKAKTEQRNAGSEQSSSSGSVGLSGQDILAMFGGGNGGPKNGGKLG